MKFLHWEVEAGPDNVIQVELSRQANVLLLDDSEFQRVPWWSPVSLFWWPCKTDPGGTGTAAKWALACGRRSGWLWWPRRGIGRGLLVLLLSSTAAG